MSRYRRETVRTNNLDVYKDILEKRGVKRIKQYKTKVLKQFDKNQIAFYTHSWSIGDLYTKLANQYYGDPQYWYIIARFNNKPTEAHLSFGDIVYIPADLSIALQVVV